MALSSSHIADFFRRRISLEIQISHSHALFQGPRICAFVPGIVVNDRAKAASVASQYAEVPAASNSGSRCSDTHKPSCDPFRTRIQPSNVRLAIIYSDFGGKYPLIQSLGADRPTGRVAVTVNSKCAPAH